MGPEPIGERTLSYSLRIVRLYRTIERDGVGRVLGTQLLRAGTSIGANVHEAQGAQTKADFVAKMSVAQKEAHETLYWLRLIQSAEVVPGDRIAGILDETQQLVKILSAILASAKQVRKQPP